jgi:hypothetical protein
MVDELLSPLLEYGPVAVDRVSERLDELRGLVGAEEDAFGEFVRLVGDRPQYDAIVVDLFGRAARSDPE